LARITLSKKFVENLGISELLPLLCTQNAAVIFTHHEASDIQNKLFDLAISNDRIQFIIGKLTDVFCCPRDEFIFAYEIDN
jgi:hypothetical protein